MECSTSGSETTELVPSLSTIESALRQVESKKEALQEAYRRLESHPAASSFLNFSWLDIDSHFSSVYVSLTNRFKLLLQSDDITSDTPLKDEKGNVPNVSSELDVLCSAMDGKGVGEYVHSCGKDKNVIKAELLSSLKFARDPGMIVLDAVKDFHELKEAGKKGVLLILQVFLEVRPENIEKEIRLKAKLRGLEWFEKIDFNGVIALQVLPFLNLVAGFGLGNDIDAEIIISSFVSVCWCDSAPYLLKKTELNDKTTASLISKLFDKAEHLHALRFICELGLTSKYPPVDILNKYLLKLLNPTCKSLEEGSNSFQYKNDVKSEVINSLELAVKIIVDYNITYPRLILEKRIEKLKNQKDDVLSLPVPSKPLQQRKAEVINRELEPQICNKRQKVVSARWEIPPLNVTDYPSIYRGMLCAPAELGFPRTPIPYANPSFGYHQSLNFVIPRDPVFYQGHPYHLNGPPNGYINHHKLPNCW